MKNTNFTYFIGIDISKEKFNYCIIDNCMNIINEGEIQMTQEGFNSLNDIINSYKNSIIAIESTGSYHLNLLSFLISKKYTAALINPALIKKFTQTITLRKTKTDKKGRKPSLNPEILRELAYKSIGISTDGFAKIIKHDVKMLRFLQEQLDDITNDFIDKINKNKKDDMDIISSIKGISHITSAHFLAEIKDIERFENHKKLSAYAGLDPATKQSGSMYSRGKISKKGSKSLRRTLYLMASGVIKSNDYFRVYYIKKRGEGMQHRKAMIALCNKLIRVIFAMLKKHEKFNPATHYL